MTAPLDAPAMVAVGLVWMAVHAGIVLGVRRWLRAPIFFAAVGVMLAVAGYVLGTYGGLVCAVMMEQVYQLLY
ncbi:hypothetical protein [Cystobacter ferrugineus]|uniref:Uncharacterized protein n=1 Tax=Cystobacter ferrugineus TaxID=83449 RepID=A0A1L9B3G1_9BACT|nr:hypothetical protein [Cystobacter ferrugineus]OJH36802.1 hypothetical protein BON30_30305 [Cystobacter ferrugineus]